MTRRLAVVTLIGLIALVCGKTWVADAAPPKNRKLEGEWAVRGWNPGTNPTGKPSYEMTVELTKAGQFTYEVFWKKEEQVVNTGIGLYDRRTDTFASAYQISNQPGVAIFEFSKRGKRMICVGAFKGKLHEIGHEEWTR